MSLRNCLSSSRAVLARPLVWAVVYLALIPSFGLIFDLQSNDFYQTSAVHEPDFVSAEERFANAVAHSIARQARVPLSSTIRRNNEIPCTVVLVQNVYTSSEDLSVNLIFDESVMGAGYSVTLNFPISYDLSEGGASYDPEFDADYTSLINTSNAQGGVNAIACVNKFLNTSPKNSVVLLTGRDWSILNQIQTALNGSVQGLPDQFGRMVYFSTVTVTTLGFGDIAPTTNTSRVEVTAEAILGVVSAGLFLNATAAKSRQRKYEAGKPSTSRGTPLLDWVRSKT